MTARKFTAEQLEAARTARSLADLPRTLRKGPGGEDGRVTDHDLRHNDFRAVVAAMLQEESPYIGAILAEVRLENPALYLKTVTDLAEYVAPKLQRVEARVENVGGPPVIEITLVQRAAQPGPPAAVSLPVVDAVGYKPITVEVDVP